MAAKKVSLAEELLQAVSPMPYKILVANIKEEDALSRTPSKLAGGPITSLLTHPG